MEFVRCTFVITRLCFCVCVNYCVGVGRHWITGMQSHSHLRCAIQFGSGSSIRSHLDSTDPAHLHSANPNIFDILED